MKKRHCGFNALFVYFVLITLIGAIGSVVSFGIFLYHTLTQLLITDHEYLVGRYMRELDQCEYEDHYPQPLEYNGGEKMLGTQEARQKTPQEIEKCKSDLRKRVVAQRALDTKESLISGVTWGILFFLLFLIHYPRMMHHYHTHIQRGDKKNTKKKGGNQK